MNESRYLRRKINFSSHTCKDNNTYLQIKITLKKFFMKVYRFDFCWSRFSIMMILFAKVYNAIKHGINYVPQIRQKKIDN